MSNEKNSRTKSRYIRRKTVTCEHDYVQAVERLNHRLCLMMGTITEQLNTIQTQLFTVQTMIGSTTSPEKPSTVALPKIYATAELSSDLRVPEEKLRDAAATLESPFDWDQMFQNSLALEVDLVSDFPLDEGLQA